MMPARFLCTYGCHPTEKLTVTFVSHQVQQSNMLRSQARVVKTAMRAVQRMAETKTEEDQKPKLEDFLAKRDFTGGVIVCEFERDSGKAPEEILPWLAYCAFHLGDYTKALETYRTLLNLPATRDDITNHLYAACCLFYLGLYEEARQEAINGPNIQLKNRILFHVSHKLGDETRLKQYHKSLQDSKEDQLSLASMHYLRSHHQQATDIYKALLIKFRDRDYLALQVYVALCYYKLDYYDVSLKILGPYLERFPDSAVATNLKACNTFKLFEGKAAEAELKQVVDMLSASSQNLENDLVKHNLVVFRNGENALQVLPPLVDIVPEARLNLAISHLRLDEITEAYELMKDVEPTTPQEFILKGVVNAAMGELPSVNEHQRAQHLEQAREFFQLVGSSPSECDTIPGRQCMASCFFLLHQFEDVLVYLNSVKPYCFHDPIFMYNYGTALASVGQYAEAENALLQVKDEQFCAEYSYVSHLARCYIMTGKPRDAWELYLKMDSGDARSLLVLIANDCYKTGAFFYSAKAFDVLESLNPDYSEYWEAKRGACCGLFQQVVARNGSASIDQLRDIIDMLRSGPRNPQVELIVRVMNKWMEEQK